MKTGLHQTLRGIVCAFLLTAVHSASAFYDPTIGRWASRDPIGEQGGINLSCSLQNDLVNSYDFLGLYKQKGYKITVEKCEIVIVFGHNRKKDPWQFEFPSTCSGGGLVACWPGLSNGKIPKQNSIGAPTHNDVGYWEAPNPNERSEEELEGEHNLLRNWRR